ncbi:MAG: ABC transporter permease [Spirochaetia bacterium]
MKRAAAFVEHIGSRALVRLGGTAYALGFFYEVLKETLFFVRRKSVGIRVLTMQILFTGVEALSVIAVLSVALGAVIIVQGLSLLPQFGQGQLIYQILITVITRELGPKK